MIDRFPYDMPSRSALVKLIRDSSKHKNIKENFVSFEDMFFSPTALEPGRTYIEMIDNLTGIKDWFIYRRLDLAKAILPGSVFRISGPPTPANIANEINRSRNMSFGPDDISFSTETLDVEGNSFSYNLNAMTGSYAYYGNVEILVELINDTYNGRLLEDGATRLLEDGTYLQLE